METIRNLPSRDKGNFGNKTQNKDKRENKKTPQKPQRKIFLKKLRKRDPIKTLWGTATVFFIIECWLCYSFSSVKLLSVIAERKTNMQYLYFEI